MIKIQEKKAESIGVTLLAQYKGIASRVPEQGQIIQENGASPEVYADESRLMQVLLNL